ncbi:MAG: tetratricopeptide repeat protein [Gammaproteobacteria bacterium]|nr:tetratricopeptide repeat protein [Gammaproteobacteria bacterium]NIR84625.1 tetratricopeptide repeat protein [Gammaproteobacteria bacterium]NIR90528.1 tetratricopeptide repeat protein [Gammaproteobacteria bacterium]NIU05676.1 tetratricopeptide repeat protein [Gammaproteobacteria bacterium]NIV52815.1 tetratricopeptide repeat protein [Gammaproteobacteria bacterium]
MLAVSGCANLSSAAEQGVLLAAEAEHVSPQESPTPPEPSGGAFSEETLYKLLVAEFAVRRNQPELGLDYYLDVARATRDQSVIARAVRLAVFARDEQRGLEAAELWTDIVPESLEARQVYAALLIRAGELDAAVEQLEVVLSKMEAAPEHRFDLIGDMLSRERDQAVALEVMERLVADRRDDPHALYALAQLTARVGELGKAVALLERVLELRPDDVRAAVFRARVLHQQGHTVEGLRALEQAVQDHPDDQPLRMTYARMLVDAKRYDDARAQFERLAQDAPDDPDVRFALGLLLLQTNHMEQAREQFEHLLALGERTRTAHYYLGQIAESLKDYDEALAHYERVDGGQHYTDAQIRVAVVLGEQGEVSVAREHLRSLQRRSVKEAVRLYQAEAEILSKHGDQESALTVYNEALTKYPDDTDLLYGRAMLAEKLDRLELLERDLRRILEIEPNNADALNALGYTLADRTDRYQEAMELIKRALEIKPDNHYILDSMGWVLYRMGRHEDALEYLRQAMSLNYDPEIAAHLGEVLWVTGDKKGAREVWDTALETTPDDERLLETIERFEP